MTERPDFLDQSSDVTPPDVSLTTGGGSDSSAQEQAAQEIKGVSTFDSGFYGKAGALLDASAPNAGDKAKVQVCVNIPVDQTGTIKVGFDFSVETEREDNGNLKTRCQLLASVLASKKASLYFVTVEAFAQFKGGGYLEASGDNGAEVFALFGLALQQRVNSVSSTIADAIFGDTYAADVLANMDENDYVESGLTGSLSAGVGVKTTDPTSGDESGVSVSGGVSASTGTKLTKGDDGGLQSTGVSQASVEVQVSADPFALGGKITGKKENGKVTAIEGEIAGEAMIAGSELTDLARGGQFLSNIISQLGSVITGKSGMLSDNGARQAAGLGSYIADASGASVAVSSTAFAALDQLEGFGAKMGHKLTVKGTWEDGKGYSLDIDLERVSQIEFGDGPRDTVYVLLENVDRVFKISMGPSGG